MDVYAQIITALLKNLPQYPSVEEGPAVAETEFVPFNLSYLRDFSKENEIARTFGGKGRSASNPLPA